MTMTLMAQVPTTLKPFPSASSQPVYLATAEDTSVAGLSSSASPVESLIDRPQAALTGIATSNYLITAALALVILSNVVLFLIFFHKLSRKNLGNLIDLKLREFTQEPNLLINIKTILDKVEKQQNLLQSMENKQQSLLCKMENMERDVERTGSFQSVVTARSPIAVDTPSQTTPLLSSADHLIHVLKQGGDRAAMAQWPVAKVKITAASRNLIYQGLDSTTEVELEPTQVGASFLIFQVNGENLLVPNQQTLKLFQLQQRDHAGLFILEGQSSQPVPQVSKPARVKPQGKLWRVVEQGEILI